MIVIQIIYPTDQIDNAFTKVNSNFTALYNGVVNITTGHDHDGENSKPVDHNNLLNKGTNTHSAIDSAINNLDSHVANNSLHVSSEEQTAWDGVVTEVINARSSTAKSTTYANLDARFEAIESDTAPSAHDSMTGRHTTATDNTDNGSRHKAAAIYDVTGNRTAQEAFDNLEEDVSNLSTDKANKATIIAEINASSEATLIEKEHVEQPDLTDSDIIAGTYSDEAGATHAFTARQRLSTIFASITPKNLVWNGTFTYLGGDPDNTRSLKETASADNTNPYTIPGWQFSSSNTNASVDIETTSGTPPWHDYVNDPVYRNTYGYKFITFKNGGDGTNAVNFQSNLMPLGLANAEPRRVTVSFWYRCKTAKSTSYLQVECGGSVWDLGTENDTDWHHFSRTIPTSSTDIVLIFRQIPTADAPEISIARVAIWDAILDSDVHLEPYAWYNPFFMPYNEGNVSILTNTSPAAGEIFKNCPEFKKTWRAELPVDSTFTAPLTLPIPPAHYVYNVRITSDYKITVGIPTTPPTTVDTWYGYFDSANTANFASSFNSISIYAPAPAVSGRLIIEVDYWPANNS